jgi:hypothetical protein
MPLEGMQSLPPNSPKGTGALYRPRSKRAPAEAPQHAKSVVQLYPPATFVHLGKIPGAVTMWVADFHRSVSIRFQDRDFLSPLKRRASAMKFWLVIKR